VPDFYTMRMSALLRTRAAWGYLGRTAVSFRRLLRSRDCLSRTCR